MDIGYSNITKFCITEDGWGQLGEVYVYYRGITPNVVASKAYTDVQGDEFSKYEQVTLA